MVGFVILSATKDLAGKMIRFFALLRMTKRNDRMTKRKDRMTNRKIRGRACCRPYGKIKRRLFSEEA